MNYKENDEIGGGVERLSENVRGKTGRPKCATYNLLILNWSPTANKKRAFLFKVLIYFTSFHYALITYIWNRVVCSSQVKVWSRHCESQLLELYIQWAYYEPKKKIGDVINPDMIQWEGFWRQCWDNNKFYCNEVGSTVHLLLRQTHRNDLHITLRHNWTWLV